MRGKSPSSAALSAYLRVRYEGYSRRASVEAARQKLTLIVTSVPVIAALRKDHSPFTLNAPRQLKTLEGQEHGR